MKNRFFLLLIVGLAVLSCSKERSLDFSKNRIGPVKGKMTLPQVKQLLKNDSLHKLEKVSGIVNQYTMQVSDREKGDLLLELIFEPGKDTLELSAVEILSPAIKSNKGVSKADPFRLWKEKHKIGHADRTLRHLVVYLKDLNATLEFDQSDLVNEAQNRLISDPDPDWVKPDAVPKRLILFMTE